VRARTTRTATTSTDMEELKETFGLADEDLNLDLGPLGRLL
jgi:Gas vesicle protein K